VENIHIANRVKKIPRKKLRKCSQNDIWKLPINDPLVVVIAYCLMPNHFHLVLYEKVENGISTFMQKLGTAYTMYFNKKYERSGGLFTKPFRSRHVDDESYLKQVTEYIHMNPVELAPTHPDRVKENLTTKRFLENYQFSSFLDYQGVARPQSVILGKASP
jgi:putative transposase